MTIDLSRHAILVTGGSRGIGKAIALSLGEAGARVCVHYRANRKAAESIAASCPDGSIAVQADLANPASCRALFDQTAEAFGRVSALVNNAGISVELGLDDDDAWLAGFDRTIAVNLRAPELLSRMAIRHFQAHGGGRLIHVASRAAFRGDTPLYMSYAASKGGMIALSRSIARGFGNEGICSFAIAPGFVRTDMAQEFMDVYGEEHVVGDLALNTLTEPSDIAPWVTLMASGLVDHATGCTVDVNAGSYVH